MFTQFLTASTSAQILSLFAAALEDYRVGYQVLNLEEVECKIKYKCED